MVPGYCALLLYAAVISPFGLDITGALASLDKNHQVRVQAAARGMQLVLHHRQSRAAHHHGLVARTMVLFAVPQAGGPDHLLEFAGATSHCLQAKLTPPAPPSGCTLLASLAATFTATSHGEHFSGASPPHRPVDTEAEAQCLCLRSTVLLI